MTTCVNCGKEVSHYMNYCDWDCQIESAKKNGGIVHTPNGLPIGCVKHDNSMWEHEHGDHPTYMFPVTAAWGGDLAEMEMRSPDGSLLATFDVEEHALIYTDKTIAMTMYECEYYLWRLDDGTRLTDDFNSRDRNWRLTSASLDKVRST